ncbi:hypothetical protein SADUNF_Sadunf08G0146400 [Salix dunnii]|uniref:Uncharacterized protein n=1 Tax=Salix dunnii TaxID=1413687 RepID=A0A835MV22_9ROSI|nr:hypothetical protein SADUNF_Sadunf08G0146400 [Salix dunnii]
MARRDPSCDDNGDDCSRGGGEAPSPCSNIYLSSYSAEQTNSPGRMSCKNYCSKCDMVGDIFYGTDDYLDVKDSIHKEDVLEHYRRETIVRALNKRKLSRLSISRCFEFLKLAYCLR